ncbi:MAG TPA: hypothetical protein VGX25_11600 [Actinophytocola sp.]|uniref:hypothetical protein n=1 Tax=Actinophytocola sp. TaxID=1872138 RepID=UPI002DDD97C6|nr:hypothetical protein [Actinophytocola sp.]HEV2780029.1 hypothetical protein [Actinophytocola sp.]
MTDGPGWASPDPQPDPQRQPSPAYPQYPSAPPPRAGALKPGVIPLRPLGVSEILDGAISTMRAHPKPTLGVSAIVVLVSELLLLVATYPLLDDIGRASSITQATPPEEVLAAFRATMSYLGIILVIGLPTLVLLSGFLTVVAGKAVLGQPIGAGEVWSRVRPRLLALLGLTMVYPAVALGASLVLFVLALAVPPLAVVVAIALVPLALWLYVLFSLATPALMLENARIGAAFGRSRKLVRGSWWRVFGIELLALVITIILTLIITAPFAYFGGGFDQVTTEPAPPTVTYLILTTIGGIIAGTVTRPFVAIVTALLYTDQRMRREGMDIELARMAGQPPP